jgi:hypothetical protein
MRQETNEATQSEGIGNAGRPSIRSEIKERDLLASFHRDQTLDDARSQAIARLHAEVTGHHVD